MAAAVPCGSRSALQFRFNHGKACARHAVQNELVCSPSCKRCVQTVVAACVSRRAVCADLWHHACHAEGCVQTVAAACVSRRGVRADCFGSMHFMHRGACRLVVAACLQTVVAACVSCGKRCRCGPTNTRCCDAPPPGLL